MASGHARDHRGAMTTKPKINSLRAGSSDFTERKFSKARSIADRLGICQRTIFRWADAGKITRHKINARVVLFDENEIACLLDRARIAPRRQLNGLS